MIKYKLGCNFDIALIDSIKKLNDKYEHSKITEVYGSTREFAFLAARPAFRLPDISFGFFEDYIKQLNAIGVSFNYTMNSITFSSRQTLMRNRTQISHLVDLLAHIGVKRITVANPILFEIIGHRPNIEIEISTIAHIDTITQIKYLKDNYNVTKICGNLLKNRNIKFLKAAAKYCNANGIQYECMTNEFCGVGGNDYTTHCLYRDSCYILHFYDKTKDDVLNYFDQYPMRYCMTSRNVDPVNWLRLQWIRPQDIQRYVDIGITNFKITGRTGTTEYIKKIAEAYMSQKWEENLLALWKPLETIYSEENELDFNHSTYINSTKLDKFLDHWFNNLDHDCSNEVCGDTCKYCKAFYEDYINIFDAR